MRLSLPRNAHAKRQQRCGGWRAAACCYEPWSHCPPHSAHSHTVTQTSVQKEYCYLVMILLFMVRGVACLCGVLAFDDVMFKCAVLTKFRRDLVAIRKSETAKIRFFFGQKVQGCCGKCQRLKFLIFFFRRPSGMSTMVPGI